MTAIPSGTVTLLFTDVEGSTRLLHQLGERYRDVVADQRRLLREIFAAAGGRELDTQGDAFFYGFARARDAVVAAVTAQRAIAEHEWPDGADVRVRIGLHTGEPAVGDEGYVGLDVVRAARICAAGHGGQILISETTRALLGGSVPEGVTVRELGEHRLKDLEQPERLFQLDVDGLPSEFPALRTGVGATPRALEDRIGDLTTRTSAAIEERVLRDVEEALAGARARGTRRKPPSGGLLMLFFAVAAVVAIVLLVRAAF